MVLLLLPPPHPLNLVVVQTLLLIRAFLPVQPILFPLFLKYVICVVDLTDVAGKRELSGGVGGMEVS